MGVRLTEILFIPPDKMTDNITPRQRDVLSRLPGTTADIADALSLTEGRIRALLSELRTAGYQIEQDENKEYYVENAVNESFRENFNSQVGDSKAAITRAANDHLNDLFTRTDDLLTRGTPPVATRRVPAQDTNEDVVIFRTDQHFGGLKRDEFGNTTFDTEIALARERHITSEVMGLIDRQRRAGSEFDTAHLLYGGDFVDGEGIYSYQSWETETMLDEQIDTAVMVGYEQIALLAGEFEHVQVVCTPGNHGELRLQNAASPGANADLIVYRMLDRLIRVSGFENVTLIRNETTNFVNFEMRGGRFRGHLRHGQDCPAHIGTPSPKSKWGTWQRLHEFDIAYRGHYHEFRHESIVGGRERDVPVIMGGSISPPGDYEESIGVWGQPGAFIHGVSDSRPLTWNYLVDFVDCDDGTASMPSEAQAVEQVLED